MKLSKGATNHLTRREIIVAHASILLVEGIIVPEQDKNNMTTYKGPNHNMPVIKYDFTNEAEGDCAFLLTHINNVKRVIDLCADISTVAAKHDTWRNSLKEEALHTYETAVVAAQGNSVHVKIGVLRRCNNSEWGAPCFIQAKKNGTVRFLTDFRELNKRIKRKPYPIPNIQDIGRPE